MGIAVCWAWFNSLGEEGKVREGRGREGVEEGKGREVGGEVGRVVDGR